MSANTTASELRQEFRCAWMAKRLGLRISCNAVEQLDLLSRSELEQLAKDTAAIGAAIGAAETWEEKKALIAASPLFSKFADAWRVRLCRGLRVVAEFTDMDRAEVSLAERCRRLDAERGWRSLERRWDQ